MSTALTPTIGKNVIETLTLGMYEDPRFIYREYVQNSADQIDVAVEEGLLDSRSEGEINILIDSIEKTITVEDNATGISTAKIRSFLGDVANSGKEPNKRKGFRGIGRLGGLGYCETLIFETSYKGESEKTVMTLNAKLLRQVIGNRQDNTDAAGVISLITTIETQAHRKNDHFFKVSLVNVTNDLILEVDQVSEYLSLVAPVEFSPKFKYAGQIKEHYKRKNFAFEEYPVTLNQVKIYKAYKDKLITDDQKEKATITSIGFFDVRNPQTELLAVGWYGISSRLNEVIDKLNPERGIRIRKGNIGIGNEQTLQRRFRVERTNFRYIGEIHTFGEGFIPNARRDYFNDNKTLEEFEKALDVIFKDFESKLPHRASDLHNRLKDIRTFRHLNETYKRDIQSFITKTEQEQRLGEVLNSLKTAENASKKIEKIKDESESNPQLKGLFNSIIGRYDYHVEGEEAAELRAREVYPPLKFSKVNKSQEDILNEVVNLLQAELGHKGAALLIQKLLKMFN